jgi:hypothetical protein
MIALMLVETINPKTWTWVPLTNATAALVESNRYLVTITKVASWVRLETLDGIRPRIDGSKETFRAWGTSKTGDTLVLDLLVR